MPEQSQILRPGLRYLTAVWAVKAHRVVHGLMLRSKLKITSHFGIADSGNWGNFKGSYCPKPAYSRISCIFLTHLMLMQSDALLE